MLEMINFVLVYGQVCFYMIKRFLNERDIDVQFMERIEAKF